MPLRTADSAPVHGILVRETNETGARGGGDCDNEGDNEGEHEDVYEDVYQ